jgi:hypothetical protein
VAPQAEGRRVATVALPAGAEPPFGVYVNGEQLVEGVDFHVEGRALRFARPLRAQPPLGLARKLMLALGIGVYGDLRGDQLDLRYHAGGAARLATALPLSPAGEAAPPPG